MLKINRNTFQRLAPEGNQSYEIDASDIEELGLYSQASRQLSLVLVEGCLGHINLQREN